jgi:hypothetical protein
MQDAIGGFFVALAVVGGSLFWSFGHVGADVSFLVLPLASCIGALAMPTAQFLAGYVFLFVLSGGLVYGQHVYVTSQPSYTGSPGEGLGLAFLMVTFAGLGVGATLNTVVRVCWRMRHTD